MLVEKQEELYKELEKQLEKAIKESRYVVCMNVMEVMKSLNGINTEYGCGEISDPDKK